MAGLIGLITDNFCFRLPIFIFEKTDSARAYVKEDLPATGALRIVGFGRNCRRIGRGTRLAA